MVDCTRQFQHISSQPMKIILHAVDNNILQNFPILREYFGITEDIYGTSVSHLQGQAVRQKVQYVEPIIVSNDPKFILDRYKNVTLCCYLMHINGIGFINTTSRHIIFATGSMIKNQKLNNIEDGINQVNKLCLKRGFKITLIHSDSEIEPLRPEMAYLGIYINCVSKKERVPEIERFN